MGGGSVVFKPVHDVIFAGRGEEIVTPWRLLDIAVADELLEVVTKYITIQFGRFEPPITHRFTRRECVEDMFLDMMQHYY